MQISTQWQTAYYTPAPVIFTERKHPRKTRCDIGKTKSTVLMYLTKHGISEKRDLMKNLGMSSPKLRHALAKLGSLVEYEQSGAGEKRMCHYWALSHPPKIEQRCASFQAWTYIEQHPWCFAADIPADIIPSARNKHMCVLTLETAGRLVSRVQSKRKQYKAVI